MRGAQLFEMVEKRGQPFYLIELKLYLISKSRAKALDLREERGVRISQRRGPLGRRILVPIIIEDACGVRPPPSRVEICELRLDLHLGGVRGMQNEVLQAS